MWKIIFATTVLSLTLGCPARASYLDNDASRLNKGTVPNARLNNGGVSAINGVSCTLGSPCTVGNYVLCSSGAQHSTGSDITEDILATCAIPAGTLTANGCIVVDAIWNYTNSANNKVLKVHANTDAATDGTPYLSTVVTTSSQFHTNTKLCGANSISSQVGGAQAGTYSANSGTVPTSSITTSGSWDIVLTGQKTSSVETLTLDEYQVVVLPF